jgi:putative PIN family toxin of toxin-antitoxin system
MRVLLDTNVLASAAVARGLCADVLRAVLSEHELVVCPQIITALRRILPLKFGMPNELIAEFVRLFQKDTICCQPSDLPDIPLKDKDDLGILAAAREGAAAFIVTGDKELLNLARFLTIQIVSPRQFWEQLTNP